MHSGRHSLISHWMIIFKLLPLLTIHFAYDRTVRCAILVPILAVQSCRVIIGRSVFQTLSVLHEIIDLTSFVGFYEYKCCRCQVNSHISWFSDKFIPKLPATYCPSLESFHASNCSVASCISLYYRYIYINGHMAAFNKSTPGQHHVHICIEGHIWKDRTTDANVFCFKSFLVSKISFIRTNAMHSAIVWCPFAVTYAVTWGYEVAALWSVESQASLS